MSLIANLVLTVALCTIMISAKPDCYQFMKMKLPSGKQIYGYQNVGNCTCSQIREQLLPRKETTDICIWIPMCSDEGTFQPKQEDRVNIFCVDKNGNQNTEAVITPQPWTVECKQE